MQGFQFQDALLAYATQRRNELINGADNGADDDLPLEERPNRTEVSPGCTLKPFDQAEVYGGTTVLVLCPGRGLGWFYCLTVEGSLMSTTQFEATAVTDRIPADPQETPMPVLPP